ncbi:Holliday junction resolvase RuvX [Patescibacteria group bacterium]|nr:Holliday junction resolvase RuvX [Patescibacteria group bacterium]
MSINSQNKPQTSQILGIDFGSSKIGLALADTETKIAFAYNTLENNKDFLQELAKIIRKENINKIIIGIPSRVNKKVVEYAGEKLARLIKKVFPEMEIEYQDEMFTTKIAHKNLISKGVKKIKRFDDQEAARIILQSWLDRE